MTQSRAASLVALLKERIPDDFFKCGYLSSNFNLSDDINFFIPYISNSAVLDTLLEVFKFSKYAPLNDSVCKPHLLGGYSIQLRRSFLNNLCEDLLALDPEKTKAAVTELFIQKSKARLDGLVPGIASGIERRGFEGAVKKTLQTIQESAAPTSILEVSHLDGQYKQLVGQYNKCKELHAQPKTNVSDVDQKKNVM